MRNKKFLFGNIITAAILCGVLVMNAFIFSTVLAATPDESEIDEVASTVIEESSPSAAEKETIKEDAINLNAITEEEAFKIVDQYVLRAKDKQGVHTPDLKTVERRSTYASASSPADTDKWILVFGNEDQGATVRAEVDAITGEFSGSFYVTLP